MWEYKIIKSDLGRNIYRKMQNGKFLHVQYLNGKGNWALSKSYAKTFYNREDALSALSIMKIKDAKKSD